MAEHELDLADLHRLLRFPNDADHTQPLEATVEHHLVSACRHGKPTGPPVHMRMS